MILVSFAVGRLLISVLKESTSDDKVSKRLLTVLVGFPQVFTKINTNKKKKTFL
jgi:hypothetical protein